MRGQLEAALRRRIPHVFGSHLSHQRCSLSVFQTRCAVLELTGEDISRAEVRSFAGPQGPITLEVFAKVIECVLRRVAPETYSVDAIYEMIDTRCRGYITADDLHSVS